MILVYTEKITPRIKYIFKFILHDILKSNVLFTSNLEEYNAFENPKIFYSKTNFNGDGIFFQANNLLFENRIKDQNIVISELNKHPIFFSINSQQSSLCFDVFSASFYLCTRYEEYLPYIKDSYERFPPYQSLAFKRDFLHLPLIDIWAQWIKKIIISKYPDFTFPEKHYTFLPTIDIDCAYAYKHKGLVRITGSIFKSIKEKDFKDISKQLKVLFNQNPDPLDDYEFQFDLIEKYKINPIYFILFADYGHNDKNINTKNINFNALIKSISDFAEIGMHPSYNSNKNVDSLHQENQNLANVVKKEITKSRQHFMILYFPDTYRNLIDIGITDDYSMGYLSEPGFRASTATPFYFYDLDSETETNLKLHPFQVSFKTLKNYKELSTQNSKILIETIVKEVKAVNGTFSVLWQNDAFNDFKNGKEWKMFYEEIIKIAK